MAKSTRSKWKKMHRRQRAEGERERTAERIRKLHHKLELTTKGGISAVPPQDPETRFHFLNPELDPRVPNTSARLNNTYRMELNHVSYDFTKPLRLPPPRTNFYGKSDPGGPHPQAVNREVVDADAPIAGHALTKADLARRTRAREGGHEGIAREEKGPSEASKSTRRENEEADDDDEDGPEEYVFELEKSTWQKARPSGKKTKGEDGHSKSLGKAKKDRDLVIEEDVAGNTQEEEEEGGRSKATRIKSMEAPQKRKGVVVAAGGSSKMKKMMTNSNSKSDKGVKTRRIVSSGSKSAKKLARPLKSGKTVVL